MTVSMTMGAILAEDVATKATPILMAERSDPLDEANSGWQFWGGDNAPLDPENAQVWAVGEVLEHEPPLAPYINMPIATKLERASELGNWQHLKAR